MSRTPVDAHDVLRGEDSECSRDDTRRRRVDTDAGVRVHAPHECDVPRSLQAEIGEERRVPAQQARILESAQGLPEEAGVGRRRHAAAILRPKTVFPRRDRELQGARTLLRFEKRDTNPSCEESLDGARLEPSEARPCASGRNTDVGSDPRGGRQTAGSRSAGRLSGLGGLHGGERRERRGSPGPPRGARVRPDPDRCRHARHHRTRPPRAIVLAQPPRRGPPDDGLPGGR